MFTKRIVKSYNQIVRSNQLKFTKISNYCSFTDDSSTNYNKNKYKRVADFYAGRSVLLTGGTGFVGKAITEKLLFSCENLDKIYLLIREKDGITAKERLNKIFESVLYDRIKQHKPDVLKKIIPIAGDVVKPKLGITPEDESEIINNVSVVLHMAATINFSSRLATTMKVNFEGTRRLLDLCHRIKNIQSFVYSSTAFIQIQGQVLSEFVYSSPATPEEVYKFIEQHGHDRKETKNFLNGSPNAYIFTKRLTESYVDDNHGAIPTAIVRPSSVTAAIKEPVAGWMDGWQGATQLIDLTANGFNRVIYGSKSNCIDFIPVDHVANATIIAAANATNYNKNKYKRVADFYAGRSVLLTGGTGFVGKAITEKLLFSCENLDKIYLLIREKDGITAEERLNKIFESVLYDRIKQHKPDVLKKIIPIAGDVVKPKLGITPEDESEIINNVSVVLHMAATINFSSRLATTMKVNFEGTSRLLDLCHRIKNIQSFVYSSTAFIQIQGQVLSEFVYSSPATPEEVYKFIEQHGHDRKETKNFLNGSPNAYIFTKRLTESYVDDNHGAIPTAIVRPSSVTAAIKEPVAGWLDGWQGATQLIDLTANGFNRVIYGSKSNCIDFIPVDHVANATIIAAANATCSSGFSRLRGAPETAPESIDCDELKVYNLTTSFENPLTCGELAHHFIKETVKNNKHDLPYPFVYFTKSKTAIYLMTVLQVVPAVLADLRLLLTGKNTKYLRTAGMSVLVRHFFSPFSVKSWSMRADNIRSLLQSLSPADRKIFSCDPTHIDWPNYLKEFRRGCFKYLPKIIDSKH